MEGIETVRIRPGVVAGRVNSNCLVVPGNCLLVSEISDVLGKQNLVAETPCL